MGTDFTGFDSCEVISKEETCLQSKDQKHLNKGNGLFIQCPEQLKDQFKIAAMVRGETMHRAVVSFIVRYVKETSENPDKYLNDLKSKLNGDYK